MRIVRLLPARPILLLALALAVLGGKFALIDRCGADLPYWDQWDSEANLLLRPFNEGQLRFGDLFIPHSEHRIFFTKALALGLYVANDRQWDARLEMVANAGLHAAIAMLLGWFALRWLRAAAAVGYLVILAIFFSTPAAWENVIGGFQSQFYFLLLFTALHLAGSVTPNSSGTSRLLASLAGAAALVSMGSGFLSAAAIIAILAARAWRDRRTEPRALALIALNGAFCVAGLLLHSPAPGNDWTKVQGVAAWLIALVRELSWPFNQPWMIVLNVAPFVWFATAWYRRRTISAAAPVLLAAWLWYAFQSAALAYGRGVSEHANYSFRYTDVRDIGFLANLFMLLLLAQEPAARRQRRAALAGALLLAAVMTAGICKFAAKGEADFLSRMPAINEARNVSVRHYLATHDDAAFLKLRPWDDLPYPLPWRLAQFLSMPAIANALPASVRPPIPWVLSFAATKSGFGEDPSGTPATPPPLGLAARYLAHSATSSGPFLLETDFFQTDHNLVSLYVAGDSGCDWQIALTGADGTRHFPRGGFSQLALNWKRINFLVPAGSYRLVAQVEHGSWMAVSQPFNDTILSRAADKAVQKAPVLLFGAAGLALVAIGIMLGAATRPREVRAGGSG